MAFGRIVSKNLILFFAICLVSICAGSAEAYDANVGDAANRLSSSMKLLVNHFESFLKSQGRWVPKAGSDDMRACNAMHELLKQTNDLKSRAGNMNASQLASATKLLESNVRNAERNLRRIGASRVVFNQFRNVENDARNLSVYSSSGYGGTYGNAPSSTDINSVTRDLDGNVQRLVTSWESYLKAKGHWKPPAGSEEMRACIILNELQQQSKSLKSRFRSMNTSDLSSNARRLRDTASDLKRQLRIASANGAVMNQMDLVSNNARQLTSMTGDDYRGGRVYSRGRNYDRNYNRRRHYDHDRYDRSDRRWR